MEDFCFLLSRVGERDPYVIFDKVKKERGKKDICLKYAIASLKRSRIVNDGAIDWIFMSRIHTCIFARLFAMSRPILTCEHERAMRQRK